MLDTSDRLVLLRWCRARRVPWSTGDTPGGTAMITLHATQGRRTLRVIAAADGMRLETEGGDTLAAASGLLALLDAVDAGIADMPNLPHRSPIRRNIAGSAIT
ncbi:MAG: hypothetical protein NT133_07925 [Alphaproteobacteria bacterium]|nr:hypothetical protein [Alphaproteobacteria bacterium]